jgi:SAM-dependent methyltransferase
MHPNSVLLFQKHAAGLFGGGQRVLEIGPDRLPSTYQEIVGAGCSAWDTIDIVPYEGLTYVARSEYHFPIGDNSYDIVLSAQVIEHVRKPWLWIHEVVRVCRRGGRVVTINPVSWHYHEAPVDCWRIYPEGMRALYEDAGLTVELSVFESLENSSRRKLPGNSLAFQPPARRLMNRVFQAVDFHNECAFDTVTIGTKVSAE